MHAHKTHTHTHTHTHLCIAVYQRTGIVPLLFLCPQDCQRIKSQLECLTSEVSSFWVSLFSLIFFVLCWKLSSDFQHTHTHTHTACERTLIHTHTHTHTHTRMRWFSGNRIFGSETGDMNYTQTSPTLESQKSYYFPSKFIFFDENSYYVAAALRGALFRLNILNVTNLNFEGKYFKWHIWKRHAET